MFHCQRCGDCCSHIRGNLPEEEKAEFQALAFGRLPIVQVVSVRDMSFPVWNFEYEEIEKVFGKDSKIMNQIKPARIIFDLDTNKALIVAHCIMQDECIFLDKQNKNACRLYNVRPLVCKQFPFQSGPFGGQKIYFGHCPAMKGIVLDDEKEKDRELMLKIFGDSYLAAAQKDIYMNWINETILKLMREKKLRPAMNYPYHHLMKRYEKAEKIMFMDFLVQEGFMTANEMEQKIKEIKTLAGAKRELGL